MPRDVPRWNGQPIDIARFVLEGDNFVHRIVSRACDELHRSTRFGHIGFASAASSNDPEAVRSAVEAIYNHLKQDYHFHYEYERDFIEATKEQDVRLPHVIVRENYTGTCLDLALLFQSCLAAGKMAPIHVNLRGHALAATWLHEPPPDRATHLTLDKLRDRLADGSILVLEATGFTEGYPERQYKVPFGEACASGRQQIEKLDPKDFDFALDVRRAWLSGVTPLDPVEPAPEGAGRHEGLFTVPHLPNRYFTGRDKVLDDLHQALTMKGPPPVVQALHGLGGVGKTQLAAEYAHRHRDSYRDILWVAADSPDRLVTEFARLAVALDLVRQPSQDASEGAMWALRELRGKTSRLLILDDALDEESVQGWFPIGGGCRTIITSRFGSWSPAVQTVPVDLLAFETARDFLVGRSGLEDSKANRDAADRLTAELDCLPLALEQAAAVVAETGITFAQYLDYYGEARSRRDLLAQRVLGSTQYPHSVAATWLTTMQRLRPVARAALTLAAFLAPEAIPRTLLAGARDLLGEGMGQIAANGGEGDGEITTYALNQALGQLRRYSMISLGAEDCSVHRLVQAVVRDGLDDPTRREWAERAVRATERAFPTAEFSQWGLCNRMLPHFDISLNHLAALYREAGDYARAEKLHYDALKILRAGLGETHPRVAAGLIDLGLLFHEMGDYAQAEQRYREALDIRGALGKDHPDFAASLNNLAALYEAKGDDARAEELYRQALDIRRKVLGEAHPHFAQSLTNLAALYRARREYAQAEPLLRQVVEVYRQALGEANPHFTRSLTNLATLLRAMGEYAQAEPLLRQAMEVYRQELGETHPHFAQCLNDLVALYRATGEHARAERLLDSEGRAEALRQAQLDIRQGKAHAPDLLGPFVLPGDPGPLRSPPA